MSKFKITGIVILVLIAIPILWVGGKTLGFVGKWANEAVDTAYQEVSPAALLAKYEDLKRIHASLASKKDSIDVLDRKMGTLRQDYEGVERRKWAREDRQQLNQWESEIDGLKLSFNNLASEYNAKMAMVNYSFCNVGELPKGASEPLPREYASYVTN